MDGWTEEKFLCSGKLFFHYRINQQPSAADSRRFKDKKCRNASQNLAEKKKYFDRHTPEANSFCQFRRLLHMETIGPLLVSCPNS
jgi:hypothetical protein